MKVTLNNGRTVNLNVTKRLSPIYHVTELEIEDLKTLYSFSLTDVGYENIYFNYQTERLGEVRQGFCKV